MQYDAIPCNIMQYHIIPSARRHSWKDMLNFLVYNISVRGGYRAHSGLFCKYTVSLKSGFTRGTWDMFYGNWMGQIWRFPHASWKNMQNSCSKSVQSPNSETKIFRLKKEAFKSHQAVKLSCWERGFAASHNNCLTVFAFVSAIVNLPSSPPNE